MSTDRPQDDVRGAEVEEADPGRRLRQVVMVLVILVCLGLVVWAVYPRPPTPEGACIPEGGLRCASAAADSAAHLEICEGGSMVPSIACPGGCQDDGGVARCRTESGALAAPVGAGCQPGMSLCTHDATALLVCRDGALARAAECPKGCVDQGDALGLFCLDATDGIRFAAGFPCPGFKAAPDGIERACGPDAKGLLRCEGGLLVPDPLQCAECAQSRAGDVTCVDSAGEVLLTSTPAARTPPAEPSTTAEAPPLTETPVAPEAPAEAEAPTPP